MTRQTRSTANCHPHPKLANSISCPNCDVVCVCSISKAYSDVIVSYLYPRTLLLSLYIRIYVCINVAKRQPTSFSCRYNKILFIHSMSTSTSMLAANIYKLIFILPIAIAGSEWIQHIPTTSIFYTISCYYMYSINTSERYSIL